LKRNSVLENNVPDSVELRKLQQPKKPINYEQIFQSLKNETAELILKNVKLKFVLEINCFFLL
jgi:hypothetical protein